MTSTVRPTTVPGTQRPRDAGELRSSPGPSPSARLDERTRSALEKVIILLRARTRNDFSMYKKSTLYRRIARRIGIHQLESIGHYVRYLQENAHEVDLLFKELLIGVTGFFRDPEVWERLQGDVLPALLNRSPAPEVLRAWVPGCSTGEEAYSLAISFKEAQRQTPAASRTSLQIFATDLDRDAIESARKGFYPANVVADVPPELLERYFRKEADGYRVTTDLRETVIFAPQNVIMDPPFTRLDLLSCRNLLIYLAPELQKKLLPLFHYSLRSGGVLLLGSAETVGETFDLFEPLDRKLKLFRRRTAFSRGLVEFPSASVPILRVDREMPPMAKPPVNLETLAEQVILQRHSPAAVLVNDQGDILYLSARTGKYLEPPVGKANLNLFAMAREGLRHELARAFRTALRQETEVHVRKVKVGTNGGTQVVDLTVQPLFSPEAPRGMVLFVFTDVSSSAEKPTVGVRRTALPAARVAELEDEVRRLQEELRALTEESQSAHEELKSANEELQSTNEELQSTNEELTTSKEELQSLNEELQTVNVELQSKVDDLSRVNNDLANLLNSTEVATVFLDGRLHVRRYTEMATRLIKLIPGDVGRPLSDLATDLEYPDLVDDAREVLRTLVFVEKEIATRDGRWFRARVMPYRTLENAIEGLVLTFIDISAAKKLEATLREQHAD